MNTKRFFFWASFLVILGLIIWGLVVAMNKPAPGTDLGVPAPVTSADHILGSSTALVTVIEYGDFQCPACALYMPIVDRLYNESSTTMRLVFRHFPLPQHANAMGSALASEAASNQGKFWEMYRLIYAGQTDWSEKPVADATKVFIGYATDLGLDIAQFTKDMASAEAKSKVESQLAEGKALGINATPTFFVNGEAVVNPQGYEAFKALIDAAAK